VRVLLVEDDGTTAARLAAALRAHGHEVVRDDPRVILVGPGSLPACGTLRSGTALPLIALVGSEHDRVTALERGADDYVSAPFDAARITERMRAVVRPPIRPEPEIPLDIDQWDLSAAERTLLAQLLGRPDQVLTRARLTRLPDLADALDAHVTTLRRKLPGTLTLEQVRGIGFRLTVGR
jgi:DNA-binding response OmpR family regulator